MKAKSHLKKNEVIEAKKVYQVILKAFPKNLRAYHGLTKLNKTRQNNPRQIAPQGTVDKLVNLYKQGKFSTVVEKAQDLSKEYPNDFVIWNVLGASRAQIGKFEEAIEAYNKSITLNPDYAEVYNNKGNALRDQGKLESAIEAFKKSIELKPDYAHAYNNIGLIFKDQKKLNEALVAYKKALSFKPNYAEAYSNMGDVLEDKGKFKKAVEAYKKALSLKPDYAEAYCNMGNALQDQGKFDAAIEAFNKSIELKPDFADAHKNLSLTLIKSGKLKEGLDKYEWRWRTNNFFSQQRHFSQPLWDGKKSLNGKRILLWCEQGIGDTLNWSSCLSLVSSKAKHCILECQEKLVPLLKRSFPKIEVKAVNRSLDFKRYDFDFHLPMGSIYKYFIHEIEKNIKINAYLIPDPVRVNFWKERLNSLGNGPYIGVCWKSSRIDTKRQPNYATISELSPVLKLPNVTFINLQYANFANDLNKIKKELGVIIHNFSDLDHFNNIDDVAALCSALDMVVSTKTTVPIISSGVGSLTKLANWKQSTWNNILFNPFGPQVDIFERETEETWVNVFNSIAEDILK